MRVLGAAAVVLMALMALAAPIVAPHATDRQFAGRLNAPPTLPRVVDDEGRWHRPFIYQWTLVNQLEQRYREDRSVRVPLAWLTDGRIVSSSAEPEAPLLVLIPTLLLTLLCVVLGVATDFTVDIASRAVTFLRVLP